MSSEAPDTVDTVQAPLATEATPVATAIPDRTAEQTPAAEAEAGETGEISKSAAKKAAKQAKMAAEKAAKAEKKAQGGSGDKPFGKSEAKKPTSKATKKKAATDEKDITVDKNEDFPGWYQQVLTKGDMLDYYDVSGCYILKVCALHEYW